MLQAKPIASAMRRVVTAREATSMRRRERGGLARGPFTRYVPPMIEGREERDPGYDDWFDEPEPLTETRTGAGRGAYDGDDEVWVLPEDERRRPHGRRGEIVIAGRTLTTTQAAVLAASVLALLLAILAAAGVFSSSKPAVPPVTTTPPP